MATFCDMATLGCQQDQDLQMITGEMSG